jgi:nucleoside 2-deoxyribosyltransferase
MKVIYVAGPYRGNGDNSVYENINMARKHARRLWLEGFAVFCPHANTFFMDGPDLPAKTFLDGDMEILRRCDAVYMLPGWSVSEGAKAEHAYAVWAGIKVIYGEPL